MADTEVDRYTYCVGVNTQPFKYKSLPQKQRIQSQYLPNYWKKLKLDHNKISPNQEDRLSNLTTKQIDRIIDMQKIKYTLNNIKRKSLNQGCIVSGRTEESDGMALKLFKPGPNKHSNVYQANFLAKVNRIAIERRIYKEKAFGQDGMYSHLDSSGVRKKEIQKQRQSLKYIKVYRSDKKSQKRRQSIQQMMSMQFMIQDQKSIPSIEQGVEQFQSHLKKTKKSSQNSRDRSFSKVSVPQIKPYKQPNYLCSGKWFQGMSTIYLDKKNSYRSTFDSASSTLDLQNSHANQRQMGKVDVSGYLSDSNNTQNKKMFGYDKVRVTPASKKQFKAKTRFNLTEISTRSTKAESLEKMLKKI